MGSPLRGSERRLEWEASGRRGPLARAWRIVGWVWRGLWLAVIIALVAFEALSHAADRRLDRELAARRASGELRPIEELVPRVPAGAENAADIYGRAFGVLRLSQEQYALLLGTPRSLWRTSPKPPAGWSREETAVARAGVTANAEYFRLLDRASRLPDCAFHVAWHRGHMTSLLHLSGLVAAGLMGRARAFFLADQGKGDEALAACATTLRIADQVEMEPDLLSQHHGHRMQLLAVDGIAYALDSRRVSAAACEELAAQLAHVDLGTRSRYAMHGEEAIYGLPSFDSARFALPEDIRLPNLGARRLVARIAPEYTLDLDELSYLDYVTRAMKAFDLSWPAADQMGAGTDQYLRRLPAYRGRLTKTLAPPVQPELLLQQVTQAELGAARIALLLKAYDLRTGRLPNSLAASGKLPSDPFTGRAYRYHRSGAGFIVYSVGPDGEDDYGRPLSQAAMTGLEVREMPDPREHYDLPLFCSR